MGYNELVDLLSQYYATNGSLSDVVAFTQLVAQHATRELRHLFDIIQPPSI